MIGASWMSHPDKISNAFPLRARRRRCRRDRLHPSVAGHPGHLAQALFARQALVRGHARAEPCRAWSDAGHDVLHSLGRRKAGPGCERAAALQTDLPPHRRRRGATGHLRSPEPIRTRVGDQTRRAVRRSRARRSGIRVEEPLGRHPASPICAAITRQITAPSGAVRSCRILPARDPRETPAGLRAPTQTCDPRPAPIALATSKNKSRGLGVGLPGSRFKRPRGRQRDLKA